MAWCCWRGPWIAWQGSLVGEIRWKDSCMLHVLSRQRGLFILLCYIFLCTFSFVLVPWAWARYDLNKSYALHGDLFFCFSSFEVKQVSKCSILWVYQRTVGVTTSYQSTTQQLLVVAQLALVGDAILLVIHTMWTDFLLALPRETYNINLLWYIIYIYLCRNTQPHIRLPSPSLTLCSSFASSRSPRLGVSLRFPFVFPFLPLPFPFLFASISLPLPLRSSSLFHSPPSSSLSLSLFPLLPCRVR